MIALAVWVHYTSVTDRETEGWTDIQTDIQLATASTTLIHSVAWKKLSKIEQHIKVAEL